jgi:hypothetical protein
MFLRLVMALTVGLVCADFVTAADPPQPQQDNTSELLHILFNKQVEVEGNINEMSLMDLLTFLSKKHGITFAINNESFKAEGGMDISEKKPSIATTNLRGLTLHQLLVRVLDSLGGTYIIKGNVVEVVPLAYAAKVAKAETDMDVNGNLSLKEPLVCAIIRQKPLTDAVELLASRYDLSVTITPQARDGSASAVSARLMNLPADKAIDMLAVQCDLRVVRKGNAFLITSREHAKTLLAEQAEKDRQKIELETLRASIHRSAVSPQQKLDLQNIPKPVLLPVEQTKP